MKRKPQTHTPVETTTPDPSATYNVVIAFQTTRIYEASQCNREFSEVIANFLNYDDALNFWAMKCKGMEVMPHEYWENNDDGAFKSFWAFPTNGYQIYVGLEAQG